MINLLKCLWHYREITTIKKSGEKEIVILGMHRSGTSLVAGWLHILGVDMGSDVHGPSEANPKGFFEDMEFRKLNEMILFEAKGSWQHPPSEEEILSCRPKLLKQIKEIMQKKRDKKLWGWKDPRTVLTVKLYLSFLKNPHFIICFRNPLSVAMSLYKRDKFPIEEGLNLTNVYNKRIINFLKENPAINKHFINFEHIFANPERELNKIVQFIGCIPSIRDYCKALTFFDRGLKHF